MSARVVAVMALLLGLLPNASFAQFKATPPSGSPFPPNGPATRTNPSPRLNQVLPDPFASRVPNPIMRPAAPIVRPGRPGTPGSGSGQATSLSRDVFRAAPWSYAPRYGRLSALGGSGYYGGYVDGGYAPYFYADTVPSNQAPLRQGRLSLYVSPLSSQVFVEGFYVGTAADFQDRGLWLEPGPHRIELRADGYETATFDVRILEDQTVNYRSDLARAAPRSDAPRVAAIPKTFYVVPGCYAGDRPPAAGRLPTGCAAKNVKTIPPVVSGPTSKP